MYYYNVFVYMLTDVILCILKCSVTKQSHSDWYFRFPVGINVT